MFKQPMKLVQQAQTPASAPPEKVGAEQVFGRLPARPVASKTPDKKKKTGASEIFGRGR